MSFPSHMGNAVYENWGESGVAGDTGLLTDASTDFDPDDNLQIQAWHGAVVSEDSMDKSNGKKEDQKLLRRLAQNREAARKSRLRKKAYVQQLENGRLKLNQLELELQRARQQGQGVLVASECMVDLSHSAGKNGALAFDMEYARWLNEHERQISDLRSAVNSQMEDNELCLIVDGIIAHYEDLFKSKVIGARCDIFHMLSGMWKTPAERIFMWLGGFRPSELLKILEKNLAPLSDQQAMSRYNLQQSSQQTEDALSQGMDALQHSIVDTVSCGSLGLSANGDTGNYMGQMAVAMGSLSTLENFLHQADLLRLQTLQQLLRILTTRQAAHALLIISDYFARTRALSALWLARPRG